MQNNRKRQDSAISMTACQVSLSFLSNFFSNFKAILLCLEKKPIFTFKKISRVYQRVLYIDIDIHHGDGVEEAFYLSDRVMTCSFHKYKDYFPGTGHIEDIGSQNGKYHAVNFPLSEGLDDESFIYIFKPVLSAIMNSFRPEAVVL